MPNWTSCAYALRVGSRLVKATALLGVCLTTARAQGPINPQGFRNKICTLFGGPDRERVQGVSVLANGDILVAGETKSNFAAVAQFAGAPPPYDSVLNTTGGHSDAYVAVMNPSMTTVKYWTYLGGDGDDRAYVAKEDSSHNIWVCGFTEPLAGSDPFPMTNLYKNGGCITTSCNSACLDIFVAKLPFDLHLLSSSAIIGGSGHENPRGTLAIDSNGFAYVSGSTTSTNFYVSSGMPGPNATTGNCVSGVSIGDAFVIKFNSNGSLVWSRCIGGAGDDNAWANVRVDSAGDVFIGGCTFSNGFALDLSGVDMNAVVYGQLQGPSDGWVAKLSASGSVRALRYLGGSGRDWVTFNDCLELDYQDQPVVIGITRSGDFPCTPTYALSNQHSNGSTPPDDQDSNDIFVAKLSNDLSSSVYSSYVNKGLTGPASAVDREEPAGLDVDQGGSIYLSGETDSAGFPTTPNAFDRVISSAVTLPPSDVHDAFLTKLFPGTSSPSMLQYSSFFGGNVNVASSVDEPGNRGRCLMVLTSGTYRGMVLLGGQTTTADFGDGYSPHLTTIGVAFPSWFVNDVRSGFVTIHDTN